MKCINQKMLHPSRSDVYKNDPSSEKTIELFGSSKSLRSWGFIKHTLGIFRVFMWFNTCSQAFYKI